MTRPRVLSIAGIDPCGGAGLGADSRTIHVCGGAAATVPTCTTVQNRAGFDAACAVAPDHLRAMLDAVAADGPIAAAKLGLCADARTVDVVAEWLGALDDAPPFVVDPVLSATAGGGPAMAAGIARALVERLGPRGAILTPNLPELRALAGNGGPRALLARGIRAVIVKGGHDDGDEVVDRLVLPDREVEVRHPRVRRGPIHGTGCAFSAALATGLARGATIEAAFRDAIVRVHGWIVHTHPADDGRPVPLAVD